MQLWKSIFRIDRSFAYITDSCRFNHVAFNTLEKKSGKKDTNCEALDGFVLRSATSTVGAADRLGMSTAMLVATVVPNSNQLLKRYTQDVKMTGLPSFERHG